MSDAKVITGEGQEQNLFAQLLQVRRGEYRLVLLMFLALLFAVSALVVGRAARDSLFLSRHGSSDLPQVYMLQAIVVGLASYLYSRVVDRKRRDRVITLVSIFLAATLVLLRLLVSTCRHELVFFVLYLWIEVVGALLLIQFWTLANDIFHSREAKRLFGIIGAGSVFAGALGGFSVRFLTGVLGATENLLYFSAAMIAAMVVCINLVGIVAKERLIGAYLLAKPGRRRLRLKSSGRNVLSDPYLLLISMMVFLTFGATTIVDYEFKVISRNHFEELYPKAEQRRISAEVVERFDSDSRARAASGAISLQAEKAMTIFFGRFYGWAGVVACIFQLLLTPRILRYRTLSLMFLPLTLLPGIAGIAFRPGLIPALSAKAADTMFRYTLNDSASQILYQPVSKEKLARAKAFIEGILKPASIGVAGALIAVLSLDASPGLAGGIALFLTAVWLFLVPFITRKYHASMVSSIIGRPTERGVTIPTDARTTKELEIHLAEGDDDHVLHVLELLAGLEEVNLSDAVTREIQRRGHDVQIAGLKYLAERGGQSHLGAVMALIESDHSDIRAEAVRTYCAIGKHRAISVISSLLRDESGPVRAAAVAGLIRHGGLDGILEAARVLKEMLSSNDEEERLQAARVLRFIGVKTFYREILTLFSDVSMEVRKAAIAAAAEVQSPELLLALVYKLGDRAMAPYAADALVKYGDAAVQPLVRALDQVKEAPQVRVNAARVLGEMAVQEAVDCLVRHLDDPSEAVRVAATRALVSARRKDTSLVVPAGPAIQQIRNELKDYYVWLSAEKELLIAGYDVVIGGLREKRRGILRRVFGLLGLILDAREVDAIYDKLNSNDSRLKAAALESVEYMLQHKKDLKTALMPIIDPESTREDLERGSEVFGTTIPSISAKAWLERLVQDPSEWTSALAVHAIGLYRVTSLASKVTDMFSSESELLRETALYSAARLGSSVDLEYYLSLCSRDPSPTVARAAKHLAAGG